MATYAIGDVQGCYLQLKALLKKIGYREAVDALWFAGDLVNRGPDSLAVLQLIRHLPNVSLVLGNHDIYLIALARGMPALGATQLHAVLDSSELDDFVQWLVAQPFIHHSVEHNATLVHAGIPPQWSLAQASEQAAKLSQALRQATSAEPMQALFGNKPVAWHPSLPAQQLRRYTLNALTRLRFCRADGELEFAHNGVAATAPAGFKPWYQWPSLRREEGTRLLFGHWAALRGVSGVDNVIALDTACVWGHALCAYRLEDGKRFLQPA